MHHPGDLLRPEALGVGKGATHHAAADHGRHRSEHHEQRVTHHQVHHDGAATDRDGRRRREHETAAEVQVRSSDAVLDDGRPEVAAVAAIQAVAVSTCRWRSTIYSRRSGCRRFDASLETNKTLGFCARCRGLSPIKIR